MQVQINQARAPTTTVHYHEDHILNFSSTVFGVFCICLDDEQQDAQVKAGATLGRAP
jgi:hypothetical protein